MTELTSHVRAPINSEPVLFTSRIERLKPLNPRIHLNCGPQLYNAATIIRDNMEKDGLAVSSPLEKERDFRGAEREELGSLLEDNFDFVLDLYSTQNETEGIHMKVRKYAADIQSEKPTPPNKKYFRFPTAISLDEALQVARSARLAEKVFAWDGAKGKLEIVTEMLKVMEKKVKPPASWEEALGDKAYLLEKSYALEALADFISPADKNILQGFDQLVIMNNVTTQTKGDDIQIPTNIFRVKEESGHISINCGGCGSARSAIFIANTSQDKDHPNGKVVVESHRCEHCGNGFGATFNPNLTLHTFLDSGNIPEIAKTQAHSQIA